MDYKGYIAYVAFNVRARLFIGRVMGMKDILTFRGTTVEALEAAFHASVDAYLARCSELKRTPERPKLGRVTLRIGSELHAGADRAARRSGKNLNQWVCDLIARETERFERGLSTPLRLGQQMALRKLRGKHAWIGDVDAMRRDSR